MFSEYLSDDLVFFLQITLSVGLTTYAVLFAAVGTTYMSYASGWAQFPDDIEEVLLSLRDSAYYTGKWMATGLDGMAPAATATFVLAVTLCAVALNVFWPVFLSMCMIGSCISYLSLEKLFEDSQIVDFDDFTKLM